MDRYSVDRYSVDRYSVDRYSVDRYSVRSATIGSTRAARTAGYSPNTMPAAIDTPTAIALISGDIASRHPSLSSKR